jgi:hypothetical protein
MSSEQSSSESSPSINKTKKNGKSTTQVSVMDALTAKIAQLESAQSSTTQESSGKITSTKDMKQFVVTLINGAESNEDKIKILTSKYSQLVRNIIVRTFINNNYCTRCKTT